MGYLMGHPPGYAKGHPLQKSVAYLMAGIRWCNGGGPYVLTERGPQASDPTPEEQGKEPAAVAPGKKGRVCIKSMTIPDLRRYVCAGRWELGTFELHHPLVRTMRLDPQRAAIENRKYELASAKVREAMQSGEGRDMCSCTSARIAS
jgi:hypothetical protein